MSAGSKIPDSSSSLIYSNQSNQIESKQIESNQNQNTHAGMKKQPGWKNIGIYSVKNHTQFKNGYILPAVAS